MSSLKSNTVFRKVWTISHDLPDENQVAFFDEDRSELVLVNELGGAIWGLLDGARSVGEISQLLASEVKDAPNEEEVKTLVFAFLEDLSARNAIVVSEK